MPVPDGGVVSIYVDAPGLTVEDVLSLVVEPLERRLFGVTGVGDVTGHAYEDGAELEARFGTDVARQDGLEAVFRALADARDLVPESVATPTVRLDGGERELPSGALSGDFALADLWEVAQTLVWRLQAVPGVERVETVGDSPRAWHVRLDPARLAAFGLSPREVEQALRDTNVALPGGAIRAGDQDVVLPARTALADDLASVGGLPGAEVRLALAPDADPDALIGWLRASLTLPGVDLAIHRLGAAPLGVDVTGADPEAVQAAAESLMARLRATPGVGHAIAWDLVPSRQLVLEIDRQAAARAGVTIREVMTTLAMASDEGVEVTELDGVPVILHVDAGEPSALGSLSLQGGSGTIVPLGSVASLSPTVAPSGLTHRDGLPLVRIDLGVTAADEASVCRALGALVEELARPGVEMTLAR